MCGRKIHIMQWQRQSWTSIIMQASISGFSPYFSQKAWGQEGLHWRSLCSYQWIPGCRRTLLQRSGGFQSWCCGLTWWWQCQWFFLATNPRTKQKFLRKKLTLVWCSWDAPHASCASQSPKSGLWPEKMVVVTMVEMEKMVMLNMEEMAIVDFCKRANMTMLTIEKWWKCHMSTIHDIW